MTCSFVQKRSEYLCFHEESPKVSGDYVVFYGESENGRVRCRISITTLAQMSRSSGEPLEMFERKRAKITDIFQKLYTIGVLDDENGITFSTTL
ncbi:MAG: DUF1488 family protein [Desulfovibrionales bacterium]